MDVLCSHEDIVQDMAFQMLRSSKDRDLTEYRDYMVSYETGEEILYAIAALSTSLYINIWYSSFDLGFSGIFISVDLPDFKRLSSASYWKFFWYCNLNIFNEYFNL